MEKRMANARWVVFIGLPVQAGLFSHITAAMATFRFFTDSVPDKWRENGIIYSQGGRERADRFVVMALDLIEAAAEAGRRVPQDLAVVGLGNTHVVCESAQVPITSISLRPGEVALQAAELLNLRRCLWRGRQRLHARAHALPRNPDIGAESTQRKPPTSEFGLSGTAVIPY